MPTIKSRKAAKPDSLACLEAAGVMSDFVTSDGRHWHPEFFGGEGGNFRVEIQSVGEAHPVAVPIEDHDTGEYAIGIIRRFHSDADFRRSALPEQIKKGSYAKEHIKVTYKGKPYRLLWAGKSQYGDKAKLAFLDGSKEFWVDLAAVTDPQSYTPAPARRNYTRSDRVECPECGTWHEVHTHCPDCPGS